MYCILNRLKDNTPTQTLGRLYVYDGLKEVMQVATLELKDLDNANSVNRIPAGTYKVVKRRSLKHKEHFHLLDVPGRSWILIHTGNYYTQFRGCIGVGYGFKHLNGDNEYDLFSSRYTLDRMLSVLPNEFELTINDNGN